MRKKILCLRWARNLWSKYKVNNNLIFTYTKGSKRSRWYIFDVMDTQKWSVIPSKMRALKSPPHKKVRFNTLLIHSDVPTILAFNGLDFRLCRYKAIFMSRRFDFRSFLCPHFDIKSFWHHFDVKSWWLYVKDCVVISYRKTGMFGLYHSQHQS